MKRSEEKRDIPMFKTILQANDGSAGAFKALALTLELAKQTGAELHMVCVEEISEFPETIGDVTNEKKAADRKFRGVLQRARTMADAQHVKLQTHLLTGHPVLSIVKLASELGADLLVVGSTGHSPLYERLIGSRADRIVHLASCPVLVVK